MLVSIRLTEKEAIRRIRALKVGRSFDVDSDSDRIIASKTAKTLFAAGLISFRIITFFNANKKYTVLAVEP